MKNMKLILRHKRLDGLDDLLDKQHRVRINYLGVVAPHRAAIQDRVIQIGHLTNFHQRARLPAYAFLQCAA
jgi:hypothetical protein